MSTRYITQEEAIEFNPALWGEEDSYVETLIVQAEWMIDSYLGGVDFSSTTVTWEKHDYVGQWPYYFNYVPTWITHIGDDEVTLVEDTDYVLKDRRVMFAETVNLSGRENTTFNFIKFTYSKSNSIPQNIKTACCILVSEMYTTKWSNAISEYTQWDFSIKYRDWGFWASTESLYDIRKLLTPHRRVHVSS